jgi:hypothetical protein
MACNYPDVNGGGGRGGRERGSRGSNSARGAAACCLVAPWRWLLRGGLVVMGRQTLNSLNTEHSPLFLGPRGPLELGVGQ